VVIAGFQRTERYSAESYADHAASAGLELVEKCSTWEGNAWTPGDDYVVFAHRRTGTND